MSTLLEQLKPGNTVYTNLRHVSKSGMTRDISCHVIKDNEPYDITYAVADLLGNKIKNNGVRIGGAGMDMGFHLVYSLSYQLFPDGFGERCEKCHFRPQSKTEVKEITDMNKWKQWIEFIPLAHQCVFSGRNRDQSGWDKDGGFALNQRWL